MSTDETTRLADMVKDIPIAMLTTHDAHGQLVARPMSHQQVEDDVDLWFLTRRDAHLVAEIAADPRVGVTLTGSSTWVSLRGEAFVVDDRAKVEELWSTGAEAWLPEGPDSPEVALVRVRADGGEYWDAPGGRVLTAISFAKSKLTGSTTDLGDNATVDL
ncbi:pyridoxamine 5'-phosphate oxidase family protein [Nocardioides sp. 1609]|uniref:pyridoxamine 5'-phosphate oxidase family protein n=1 Tax=Nocardioides sp. 1609 TaxID=2508327 RepID=UPI001070538C|nr:pyridoxamine 5'-phosphate oxidase family protein [Nocardioides sp. 1609]